MREIRPIRGVERNLENVAANTVFWHCRRLTLQLQHKIVDLQG